MTGKGRWLSRAAVLVGLLCACVGCPLRGPITSTKLLIFDDYIRTYQVHVPPSYDGSEPVPLVVALHPAATSGSVMARLTEFNELADREGFIVVYPEGIIGFYSVWPLDPRSMLMQENIDTAFISALLDQLTQDYYIDESRMYVAGSSNGGMMSYLLGCELSDRFAAVADVMGAMFTAVASDCRPTHPMPIMIIHGTEDRWVPADGGMAWYSPFVLSAQLSVYEVAEFWVMHNSCDSSPAVSTVLTDKDPGDGTWVWREAYTGGDDGAEVILYVVEGGGHSWPGADAFWPEFLFGPTTQDFDATETIWEFFERHQRM